MVIATLQPLLAVLAAQERLLERLDPETRARVVIALAGLTMLGLLLVLLVWLGARMTRRYINRADRPGEKRGLSGEDDWYRKSLTQPDPPEID